MSHNNTLYLTTLLSIFLINLLYSHTVYAATLNGFDLSRSIVPVKEIYSGGPPRDGIPALTDPEFVRAKEAGWLQDDSRILGVHHNGIAKAYPLNIMNWHEIVNDKFGKDYVLVTYCPLCFSGMAFDASLNNERHIFGVSGLLYNSDVLLYDRNTGSLWSQIKAEAISGEYVNNALTQVPLSNTTWQDWRTRYPDTRVLSNDTGHLRQYSRDPYQAYRQSEDLYFPVKFRSKGYHPKEMVIGVKIGDAAKAYPSSELARTNGIVTDTVAGRKIHIKYNQSAQAGDVLDEGCNTMSSVTLYWFAWYTFNPDTGIYKAREDSSAGSGTAC